MPAYTSDFMRALEARGLIHQNSNAETLDALAAAGSITAYSGFDCNAPSLHIGHLMPIMMLRRLQQAGHKPIVILGGGTTKIGDPSFKDESRPLLSEDEIASNIASIKQIFERFLTFGDGPTDAILYDNSEWLDELQYLSFLRDVGPHFTINRMLTFESVKLRLEREHPLTFLEFNYMILQAYDFLELNRRHGCVLQIGGSDQWGNIINGIELVRRIDGTEVHGVTCPLITTASGQKMGKSVAGAVWLNADMLSPWDYWQFWRNTEDADVGRFMRLFTDLPEADIARYEAAQDAEINEAKKVLANEATRMAHGEAAAREAAVTARQTFEEGGMGSGLPTVEVAASELGAGIALFELMRRADLCKSNGEARRLIKGGGARINDTAVQEEMAQVKAGDVTAEGVIKISAGKKRHALIKPV